MAKYIGNIPSVGEFKKLDSLTSTFNGSLTQFDLEYGSTSVSVGDASQLIVSLNGIIQEPLTAYTLAVGGSAIVFSSAPASTDTCHIILLGGVGGTSTVSDGAVTAAKLDPGLKDYLEETYTANGSQTTYTLTRAPIGTNDLMITIDGIVQPSTAYSIAGTTLTISPALPNGTDVRVVHMGVRAGFVVPSSSSITAAMFQDFTTDVKFNDNAKALFGTSDDLQIYHDAGGFNQIVALNDHPIQIKTATENMIKAIPNGGVEIYHNNSERFTTTSTGIDVTGTVTSDGLSVDSGSITIATSGTNTLTSNGTLRFDIDHDNDATDNRYHFTKNAGAGTVLEAREDGDVKFFNASGANAKFYWDASTERLGLGTSSPSSPLQIQSSNNQIRLVDSQNTSMYCVIETISDAGLSFNADVGGAAASSRIQFNVDNDEKMRIDNDGNVLVGTTSTDQSIAGHGFKPDGFVYHTRDGGAMLRLNRLTSDGTLMQIQKDGTTVGSIDVAGSNDLAIYSNATGHKGIRFGQGYYFPTNNSGVAEDNAVDIGTATHRFRDIYLSSGIHLGGSGPANKLDDYEEGTFTPVLDNVSCSYSAQTGTYTKVGNLVTARFEIGVTGLNTGDGSGFQIGDLPFVCGASGVLFTMDTENSTVITNKQNILGARPIVSADGVRLTDNGGEYAYNNGTSSSGSLIGMVQYFTT